MRPPRRDDGWDERYVTSMGGVSITYFENGVVKRAYPGANVTFTFPDGRAEQFGIGEGVPYPPPPGTVVPMEGARSSGGPLAYVARVVLKGVLFGVIMFVTYLIATVLVM